MQLPDGPLEERVFDSPPSSGPLDPLAVPPTSSAAPSSQAPDFGSTSGDDSAQPAEAAEPRTNDPEEDPLPEFDPRFRQPFTGLLHVGALTKDFEWLGHHFVIRTLTTGELAEVALIAAPYQETAMGSKVMQVATVAACVISVDGKPLPAPIGTDPLDTQVRNRFEYVKDNWYPSTHDAVYEAYYLLEVRVRELIEAMGNPSG